MSDLWQNIWMKNGLLKSDCMETNKLHLVKWCDACETSESIMKAPEYFFLKDTKLTLNKDKPCLFLKQLPFMKKSGERNA